MKLKIHHVNRQNARQMPIVLSLIMQQFVYVQRILLEMVTSVIPELMGRLQLQVSRVKIR